MNLTRRDFTKLALTAPVGPWLAQPLPAQAPTRRPNSEINGVNVGAITYSYRSMPDQSAEAYLRYIVDSGISQIEFSGGPVEAFAGAPTMPRIGPGGHGVALTADQQAQQREALAKLRAWRTSVSMDRFNPSEPSCYVRSRRQVTRPARSSLTSETACRVTRCVRRERALTQSAFARREDINFHSFVA